VLIAQLSAEKRDLRTTCTSLRAALQDAIEHSAEYCDSAVYFKRRFSIAAPFHAWHEQVCCVRDGARESEHVRRERLQRMMLKALLSWRCCARVARAEGQWRTACDRFMHHRRNRTLQTRSLSVWVSQASRGGVLRRLADHLSHRLAEGAWGAAREALLAWQTLTSQQKSLQQIGRKTVLLLRNLHAGRALRTWRQRVTENARVRRVVRKAVGRWGNRALQWSVERWSALSDRRRRDRCTLEHVDRRRGERERRRVFAEWLAATESSGKLRRISGKVWSPVMVLDSILHRPLCRSLHLSCRAIAIAPGARNVCANGALEPLDVGAAPLKCTCSR